MEGVSWGRKTPLPGWKGWFGGICVLIWAEDISGYWIVGFGSGRKTPTWPGIRPSLWVEISFYGSPDIKEWFY